jgi:hypothetical protein
MSNVQRFEVEPAKAASQFQKLPTVAREILRLCDGRRTVEAICASSPLDGDGTLEVLRRLGELGVVVARSRPRKAHAGGGRKISAWLDGDARPGTGETTRPATAFVPPPPVVALTQTAPPVEAAAVAAVRVEDAPVAAIPVASTPAATVSVEAVAVEVATIVAVGPAVIEAPVVAAPATVTAHVVTLDLADFSADEERFFASSIDHLVED